MSFFSFKQVLVGAASKGIIQREYQHNAMVYKSAYAKNPFDNVTDAELADYKQYVEKKQRGEPGKFAHPSLRAPKPRAFLMPV